MDGTTKKAFYTAVNGFNLITSVWMLSNFIYLETDMDFIEDGKKNPYKFISLWDLVFYKSYMALLLFLEFVEGKDVRRLIEWRNFALFSIVYPLTMVTSVVYWAIQLYDRELIYPAMSQKYVPPVLPHIFHTIPPIIISIHLLYDKHDPPSMSKANRTFIGFVATYIGLVCTARLLEGKWAYIFMNVMPARCYAWFSIISFSIGMMFLYLGYALASTFHTEPVDRVKTK